METRGLEEQLEALHGASFSWSLACCGGDPTEAEDVLQTVYLKVLDGRARFGGHSSLKTWLFAVIRRTAAGRRRRRALRALLLERWAGRRADRPAAPSGEAEASAAERSRRLRRLLGELSWRQRQVLDLVFYHDLTVREAASVMGVSIGSARVHYDRGKRKLLRRLDKEEWLG